MLVTMRSLRKVPVILHSQKTSGRNVSNVRSASLEYSSHVTVVAQRSELDVDGKLDIGFYWIQCLE